MGKIELALLLEEARHHLHSHQEEYHHVSPFDLPIRLKQAAEELRNSPTPCPFCAAGAWRKTATAGRLECGSCGAQALVGHCEVKVHSGD